MNTQNNPTFTQQLQQAWTKQNSLLCVGLDPDIKQLPASLKGLPVEQAFYEFSRNIIDATAPFVCAFKPQIAYFSAYGCENVLQDLIAYSHERYPDIPIILDSKRGDIGSTATQYAIEAFERYRADAVTVSPYMGFDSVEPYLAYENKGVIILCRTSNFGGSDLQFLNVTVDGQSKPLYQHVAHLIANKWNTNGQCALVIGATFPDEIKTVRDIVGGMPLLIPGIGAQGGDLTATMAAGQTQNGQGVIINSSRSIIYASPDEDYALTAGQAALTAQNAINKLRR